MADSLTVGIIGGGFIGQFHTYMLRRAAEARFLPIEIGASFDLDPEKAANLVSAGWSGAKSAEEVCDRSDVVWICVPTGSHKELVEMAVGRVRAIFCEKPLGRNLAEAEEIAAIASGMPTQVGLVLRTAPPFRVTKAEIDAGRLGQIQGVTFSDDQFVPIQKRYASGWRGDASIAGSGVLLEHSIHDVDLIDWMVGPVEWVRAEIKSFIDISPGIEDFASLQMGLAGGGVATLNTSWHNVLSRESCRHIEIMGTDAVVVIDDEVRGPVEIYSGEETEVLESQKLVNRVFEIESAWNGESDLLEHVCNEDARFCRAVLDGNRPTPDFDDALRPHKIVEAAYESGRTGERVAIG